MKIAHIAIWCLDLEKMRQFYERYFLAKASKKYVNEKKQFESYFLHFEGEGARLELMHQPNIKEVPLSTNVQHLGLAHIAYSAGSREKVEALTKRMREEGYYIAGEPRVTGDGYYESVVLDPEGNIIEICDK